MLLNAWIISSWRFLLILLRFISGYDDEKSLLMSQKSLEKRFGSSPVFVAATFMEYGGIPPSTNPATLLKEAIHVISCGYEDKTEWGKEVPRFVCFILICFAQIFWFFIDWTLIFSIRLDGFMDLLLKIFLPGLRCMREDGFQSIACLLGQHLKGLPLSIFLIV